jgi:hypothetical protein
MNPVNRRCGTAPARQSGWNHHTVEIVASWYRGMTGAWYVRPSPQEPAMREAACMDMILPRVLFSQNSVIYAFEVRSMHRLTV